MQGWLHNRKINITLNRKLLEEVKGFKSHVAVDGRIDGEVKIKVNKIRKVYGGMKRVFKCRTLGMNGKRKIYEEGMMLTGVIGLKFEI